MKMKHLQKRKRAYFVVWHLPFDKYTLNMIWYVMYTHCTNPVIRNYTEKENGHIQEQLEYGGIFRFIYV